MKPAATFRPSPSFRRAFTLVELLTVIAIIGVLAAIIIPVVSKVRAQAKKSTCVSRLHALGQTFQLFANDNKGRLPRPYYPSAGEAHRSRWPRHIAPYIGPYQSVFNAAGEVIGYVGADLYQNPAIRDPAVPYDPHDTGRGVFGYNVNLDSAHLGSQYVRVANMTNPGRTIIMGTSGGGLELRSGGPSPEATQYGVPDGQTDRYGPAPNYGRQAIFLFADWHVEARDVCDLNAWPWNADPSPFRVQP